MTFLWSVKAHLEPKGTSWSAFSFFPFSFPCCVWNLVILFLSFFSFRRTNAVEALLLLSYNGHLCQLCYTYLRKQSSAPFLLPWLLTLVTFWGQQVSRPISWAASAKRL